MDSLKHFVMPLLGLYQGVHHYSFDLDKSFFAHFEQSPVENADLKIDLILDKQSDFISLDFNLQGTIETNCDRCLADIHLPVENQYLVLLKPGVENAEEEIEEDVVYIDPDTEKYDISPIVYEVACLSIPLTKIYDCASEDPKPCNEAVLNRLEENSPETDSDETALGEALKNIKIK
ncbi:MAG TPA: DUF177 domain-containing protein [Saprospiraceae bacterium]|nr:DUF177 domain-containing protein [Saprospiraceae bacterium]